MTFSSHSREVRSQPLATLPPGSIPGTLNIKADAASPRLILIDYSPTQATRLPLHQPQDCVPYLDSESVSWLDVQGLGSEETLRQLGQIFKLHALVLETVVNVPQRPKVEDYGNQLLVVTQMSTLVSNPSRTAGNSGATVSPLPQLMIEQVSFILQKNDLLTIQEEPLHDCFGPVRDRIHHAKGIIRQQKADYLFYALLDAMIDGFFPILETYGEVIETLEDEVIAHPTPQTLAQIHQLKRDLLTLRRAIWPQRELLATLVRDDCPLIGDDVQIYLRDCYDHTVQILDMVETYRELAASLMDVYLSAVSNRMNEVMKTLTVISTIFIPLTFIAGIYGMNFNPQASPWNMPELNWYWGYPLVLGGMGALALTLILFFWQRGWFRDFSQFRGRDATTRL
ncbi:magnesium/cobalt transporter CorA [Acaryochloris sp. CCMEE 5410]|uniref:magnesium/cobalt transporter CorA n=1 Tax=Acaryochloris sp. CCMEE 5410 TaxID=310037 RepID=UPI0002483F6D|nr:magnesium/cobalt transporter CorA [Acaryochloris sp. CCMEE 5410]KAI9134413.1 magnesium/cobalt transporter CorA [Acaryochloris sp. CCMEE 5410]